MKFNNVVILAVACALAFQQLHAGQGNDRMVWLFRNGTRPGEEPTVLAPPAGTIWRAVQRGDIRAVERPLNDGSYGVDDVLDGDIRPLTIAVWRGHLDVAQVLIDRGARIESVDRLGYNVLHRAADAGNYRMLALLLKRLDEKSDAVNAQANCGGTPLYFAACAGNIPAIRLLVAHDAQLEINTTHIRAYRTALAAAVESAQWRAAQLLVSLGADLERIRFATSVQEMDKLQEIGREHLRKLSLWFAQLHEWEGLPKDLVELIKKITLPSLQLDCLRQIEREQRQQA